MVDYFAVLGLTRSAKDAEIKEAYRRLAKVYHPDSNPNDPEAIKRMKLLNEAKTVLFDPVRREEHRVTLGLREKLTAERLAQLRNEERFQKIRTAGYSGPAGAAYAEHSSRYFWSAPPRSPWDRKWRRWLNGILVLSALAVVAIVTYQFLRDTPVSADPIRQIINRNQPIIMPFDSSIAEVDTMTIVDDTLPHLKRHGDILFSLGEYKSASKYYERYLQQDSTDDGVITNLSYAYFKRGKYARSLEVLSREMHGDSNLIVAYYNIGELFLKESKPFDARNAFEAAVQVGNHMRAEGKTPSDFYGRAKSELAKMD